MQRAGVMDHDRPRRRLKRDTARRVDQFGGDRADEEPVDMVVKHEYTCGYRASRARQPLSRDMSSMTAPTARTSSLVCQVKSPVLVPFLLGSPPQPTSC